jgi:sulfite reductase beta subunit-like hemoprotein
MTTTMAFHTGTSMDDEAAPLVRRIRSEFLEMPGLRLTPAQASRLWDVDRQTSEAILGVLEEVGFLSKNREGAYVRTAAA